MGQTAAKKSDRITATDIHIVMVTTPTGTVPTPLPSPFSGAIDDSVSSDVFFEGKPAAVVGSTATNMPSHVPQGGSFQREPSNKATIRNGSTTVLVNGKGAARNGDVAMTCNDPTDQPIGSVVVPAGTILIGG